MNKQIDFDRTWCLFLLQQDKLFTDQEDGEKSFFLWNNMIVGDRVQQLGHASKFSTGEMAITGTEYLF